jgi:Na+/H+-dicarboxylate symporter
MWLLVAFVIGIIVGVILRTVWKSKKLDESGKIMKDTTLTNDQKLAKMKEIWG